VALTELVNSDETVRTRPGYRGQQGRKERPSDTLNNVAEDSDPEDAGHVGRCTDRSDRQVLERAS